MTMEIAPITLAAAQPVVPTPVHELREVADAEAVRFEKLVEIRHTESAEQADVQAGLLKPEGVEGSPPNLGQSIGDALVDGIIHVKNEYDGSFRRINELMAATKGEEISMQQALAIQYELMQVGLSQELTAKMADKTSSGVQTLFRNQG
jgi:hypothetical protein